MWTFLHSTMLPFGLEPECECGKCNSASILTHPYNAQLSADHPTSLSQCRSTHWTLDRNLHVSCEFRIFYLIISENRNIYNSIYSFITLLCPTPFFKSELWQFFWKKILVDKWPFYGATDTPILNFWWSLLWVSTPEWAALFAHGRTINSPPRPILIRMANALWHYFPPPLHNLQLPGGYIQLLFLECS